MIRTVRERKTNYCQYLKFLHVLLFIFVSFFTTSCSSGVLNPKGEIASYELKLLIFSILLMLIVVIPVIFLTFWFGWRYRASAKQSKYRPDWCHSTLLELVWWTIPFIIILILATVTWISTHRLDPFRPLDSDQKPINVEVVALDWKWLFIYPDYKVASINYFQIPINRPINFKITAAAPMNSFVIPELGGQIYAMTGMVTEQHLIADQSGKYRGFSANYTGAGFAEMQFYVTATTDENFDGWIKQVKKSPQNLSWDLFWSKLMPPSVDNPVHYFGGVEDHLFNDIVMSYMMPGFTASGAPLHENLKDKSEKLGYEHVRSANWKVK